MAALVGELTGVAQANGDPPVIFELPGESLVVWEKWRGISHGDRASIILEAYERADTDSAVAAVRAPDLVLTIGATAQEAIDMNLLPFSLKPNVSKGHGDYQEVERLMMSEGAIALGGGRELRLPSEELARQSLARLSEKSQASMPEVHWELRRTVGRDQEIRWKNMEVGS